MNRITPIALALTLAIAFSAPTLLAVSEPPADPRVFTIGEGAKVFESSSARGGFLALHVLSGAASDANAKFMVEIASGAPTLAGVRHVFVQNAPAEIFAATAAAAPASVAGLIYRDANGALAGLDLSGTCEVKGTTVSAPAIVLFDAGGREIFRKVGTSDTDRIRFPDLARTLETNTKDASTRESNLESGLALQGYDPVAYVDQQKAIRGEKRISSSYRGVTYRFSSSTARDAFNAAPARYLPAYGGWCATAMADNRKVEVDPRNFKITGGRLFLFYKGFLGNALNDWNKDEPGLTAKADAHWAKIAPSK